MHWQELHINWQVLTLAEVLPTLCFGPGSYPPTNASFENQFFMVGVAIEVDACAILSVLKKAKKLGLSKIHILSHALRHGRNSRQRRLKFQGFEHDILKMANTFNLIDFSFISRTINEHVHSLAKLYFAMDEEFVWTDVFLDWLFENNLFLQALFFILFSERKFSFYQKQQDLPFSWPVPLTQPK